MMKQLAKDKTRIKDIASGNKQVTDNVLHLGKTIPETILRLSWPAILEQFLICMATLADTAMVGSIGAAATASVAINISTIWLINGCITALSAGFSYMVAHAIGEGNRPKTEAVVRQSVTASLLLGTFLMAVVLAIHRSLPVWLGAASDVLPGAIGYMGLVALGLIPQTLGAVLSAVLRSAGNTRIPLAANIGANGLNIAANFFLIYPVRRIRLPFLSSDFLIWGAGLKVQGAALATTLSQYALAAMLLWSIYHAETSARITLQGTYRLKRPVLSNLFRISIPVFLERATLCFGQITLTAMISVLGTIPLAAHYLTNQTEGLLYLPAYGFAYTATTLVGQSLGAGDKALARQFAGSICRISSVIIVAACIPVYLFSGPIIHIFTGDAQVLSLGTITLKIAAATELFFSFSIIISGICRGSGDVKFPLLVSLIGMWGFRIGLVWIAVRVLHMGVIGVWAAIGIDSFIRSVLCLWRLLGGHWIRG